MRLDNDAVRTIDRKGGTVLHTSRVNPKRMRHDQLPDFLKGKLKPDADGHIDCTDHVERVLKHLGIDVMVTIGGDGTLSYSAHLHRHGQVKVVSIPKTMDNDVYGTDYCIGFSTAVTRSVDYINALRTSTGSHERIAVVELFGRHSGESRERDPLRQHHDGGNESCHQVEPQRFAIDAMAPGEERQQPQCRRRHTLPFQGTTRCST